MSKGKKFGVAAKIAMVGIPLIIAEGVYLLLFRTDEAVTAQKAIETAVSKVTGLDERRKALMRVQLAVSDFMNKNNGRPPASLEELKAIYFDVLPIDPKTGKPFSYKVENKRPLVGFDILTELGGTKTPKLKKSPEEQTTVETDIETVNFVYDPTGKRDPFKPFDLTIKTDRGKKKDLERYDYGQLKLTAVLGGFDEPQAIVENSIGRGFTVKRGTKIGPNGGEVVEILPDRILILETSTDFTGETKNKTIEMRLRTKDQEQGDEP